MVKREKKTILTGISRETMEEAFGAYAAATAHTAAVTAALEARIVSLREAIAPELARLTAVRDEAAATIEAFALERRAELFARTKSLKTAHGAIGFRTGTPRLKTRRGFTWAAVLELLKVKSPEYVRTTEEIDKARIIADREAEAFAALMPSLGVEVVQDETFFIELKTEDCDPQKK